MLYDCVECGRAIASDARRCPYCGTNDAGHRAICAHGAQVYYSVPDWREREEEKKARDKAASAGAIKIVLISVFIGALIGAVLFSGIGFVLGGFIGFFVGGSIATSVYK